MMFTFKNRSLRDDQNGIAAVEFALISPVFCAMLLGTMDVGHSLYMQSVLQGTVQEAARDSSLQTGTLAQNQADIDKMVTDQVKNLNANMEVTITRRSYYTYTEASAKKPEDFVDSTTNPDNICNNSETYVDANDNGIWDKDGAVDGQGGARDKAVYTVLVKYDRVLPIAAFVPGLSSQVELTASTVLANQPYGEQNVVTSSTVKNCT